MVQLFGFRKIQVLFVILSGVTSVAVKRQRHYEREKNYNRVSDIWGKVQDHLEPGKVGPPWGFTYIANLQNVTIYPRKHWLFYRYSHSGNLLYMVKGKNLREEKYCVCGMKSRPGTIRKHTHTLIIISYSWKEWLVVRSQKRCAVKAYRGFQTAKGTPASSFVK